MTTLRHPNIEPAVEIEVEDDHVPAYLATGWLLAEPLTPNHPDSDASGDESDSEE